jgi:hypothetical protein
MNGHGLRTAIQVLETNQTEFGRFLDVDVRTVRRWCRPGHKVPGPVEQAISAWLRLRRYGMRRQLAFFRMADFEIGARSTSSETAGVPWEVDLRRKYARLGSVQVNFELLPSGGFCPVSYSRKDEPPNLRRDRAIIEAAVHHIRKALSAAQGVDEPHSSELAIAS